MKRETRLAPPEKQVNSLSDDRMNAMNQDNDPMEQEEPMLPEDDAFLLDFPLRQAVPGEPEQPASVPLLSSSAAHSVYEGMTDEDVVSLCRTGDSVAVEYLLNKYKNFVRSKARSYFLIGADHEDIVQEGMIGLYKAIRDFRPEKLASFRAFAELCITRQIITAIKTATRQKHIPLNSYVSLNKPLYDEESDRTLLDVCGGAPVTLHRCIDVSRDLCATYRAAAALGIDTVLTSGGAGSCRKGISQLAALLRLRDELDGPEVLIGAGVNAAVIDELRAALPGARAFHASCKTLLESGMTFRREGVPMGLPGLDEWHIQQTDADAVCAAKAAVMR